MDKFEFVAVLLSIIFGLAITNLLSGMLRAFFRKELTDTRVAWSLTVGLILLVNWWGFFRWSDHQEWQFVQFLFLMFWATVHYLLAVSIYPYDFLDNVTEELRRKFFLSAMFTIIVVDFFESLVRGEIFDPWFYPLFMVYLAVLVVVALVFPRPQVIRISGWVMFMSVLAWTTIIRGVLVS